MIKNSEEHTNLIKKALAIAILSTDHEPTLQRSNSEVDRMKQLLEGMVGNLDDMVLLITSARRSIFPPHTRHLAAE